MTVDEYTTYQNMVASGMDEDLAFQQLVRWTQADLQVETQSEEEQEPGDISEQPETKIDQISQN